MSSGSDLPGGGHVVILSGPSSSGKSSLARAVQALAKAARYHHLQLDVFRDMEPPGYWDHWEADDPASVEFRLTALWRAAIAATVAYARHGQNVLFDVGGTDRRGWRHILDGLLGQTVHLVGVSCSTDELARREAQRGDRPVGLATGQAGWIHQGRTYDLMMDTTARSPEDCAKQLVDWLDVAPAPAAFDEMRLAFCSPATARG
jgi:chloramphenicol 3-O phosphotransferase